MKRLISLTALSVAAVILVGCGTNETKIAQAQTKIDSLAAAGLPDEFVNPVVTQLANATADLKRMRNGEATRSYKMAMKSLKAADSIMANSLVEMKPKVTNRYLSLKETVKDELTGLHQKEGDSLLADALIPLEKQEIFLADTKLAATEKRIEELKKWQDTAKVLAPKVIGTWSFTNKVVNTVDPSVNAVQKKTFVFNKDGSATYTDEQTGKEDPTLKRSFKYTSYGTWAMKGTQVHLLVTRLKAEPLKIEVIHLNVDGSVNKVETQGEAAYDSTYSNGSQNRRVEYQVLTEDFTRK